MIFKENTYLRHTRLAIHLRGRDLHRSDEILSRVAAHHAHRQLRAGEDDRLGKVFEHETQGRGTVSHGIRAV